MISFERYTTLRSEISSIKFELDTDPAQIGVGNINRKISEVHAYKERVASILGEAITNVYKRDHLYQESKLDYDIKFEKLLNSDDQIKNLKSEGLRTAACNSKIPDEYMRMCNLKIDLNDAEGFLKFVQTRFNQLESANSNLSRQISVIELQMDIGEIQRVSGNPFRERTLSIKEGSGA